LSIPSGSQSQGSINWYTKDTGDYGGPFNTDDKGWHLTARGDGAFGAEENDLILFKYDNSQGVDPWSPILYFDYPTGNVGIGTKTPSAKLHVAGNLRVDGAVEGLTATTTGCEWVRDSCEVDGGALIFLDRANNLNCPANKFLVQFDVVNCDNGDYRMDYQCCGIAVS
tara:strand:- start:2198 stop:2701 length:504 start_codon:yes stop_codon:yes gene_type:complete